MGRGPSQPTQIVTPATPAHPGSDSKLIADHPGNAAEMGQYAVPIFDENGSCITVQHFSNMEQAQKFAQDLKRYEARLKQVRQGLAEPGSDQF
jgi:hypothetical protein